MKTQTRIFAMVAAMPVFILTFLDILKDHMGVDTRALIYGAGDTIGDLLMASGGLWDTWQRWLVLNIGEEKVSFLFFQVSAPLAMNFGVISLVLSYLAVFIFIYPQSKNSR